MMDPTEAIKKRALESKLLAEWIEATAQGSEYPDAPRVRLVVQSFSVSLEHHVAIAKLVLFDCPLSAMAVARSQFESLIRGIWFLNCATDEQIGSFRQFRFDPKLSMMLTALRNHPVAKGGPLHAYLEGGGKKLHGWTHGGNNVLNGLIDTGGGVDGQEVFNLLVTSDGFALVTTLMMSNGSNNEALRNGATERIHALREEALPLGL